MSATKLERLSARIQQTRAILQSNDPALIATLGREDILGDMFHAGTLGYFGEYMVAGNVMSLFNQAKHNLHSAYGTLGHEPKVLTLFGLPRAIQPGGVAVNVRLAWVVQSLDGSFTKMPELNLQAGLLSSALEHGVPEQMLSTLQQPVQGVSAVKALQIASSQGQRIYRITPQNEAQALPNLRLDSLALDEIRQALATGKEVIAHTDRISVPGFTGEGYILFDPVSGSGAYKITGGSNGGFLGDAFEQIKKIFQASIGYIAPLLELAGLEIASWAAQIADLILTLLRIKTSCSDFWAPWLAGLTIAFFVAGALLSAAVALIVPLFWAILVGVLFTFILIDTFIDAVIRQRCN